MRTLRALFFQLLDLLALSLSVVPSLCGKLGFCLGNTVTETPDFVVRHMFQEELKYFGSDQSRSPRLAFPNLAKAYALTRLITLYWRIPFRRVKRNDIYFPPTRRLLSRAESPALQCYRELQALRVEI